MSPLALLEPITSVLSASLILFAFVAVVVEMPEDMHRRLSKRIDRLLDTIVNKVKFLAEANGRGLFYFFQGSLWLGLAGPLDVVELAFGGMFIFLAVLHFAMGCGIMPKTVVKKMRSLAK